MSKFRFKIRTLIGLISLVSVCIAYVTYHRTYGKDRLVESFEKIGSEMYFEQQFLLSNWGIPTLVPQRSQSNWGKLLGRSVSDLHEVWFNNKESDTGFHFDRRYCSRVRRNLGTHSIVKLGFCRNSFDEDSALFFENWDSLKYLEFRDTPVPESWRNKLKNLGALERVVISGAKCNLDPQDFLGCENLKQIQLADRGVDSGTLIKIRESMPNVEIQLIGGFDTPWKFSPNQSLSRHDPVAFAEIESQVKQLHSIFAKFDPPVEMNFNPPASEAEIAALEQKIGRPLPKYVRAFLEFHNGQTSESSCSSRWLSCNEMIACHEERLDNDSSDQTRYDFDPQYDFCSNPNYLQLTSCMGASLGDGSLSGIDDQTGPWASGQLQDMKQLLEKYAVYLRAQLAKPNSGEEVARGTMLLAPDFWMND